MTGYMISRSITAAANLRFDDAVKRNDVAELRKVLEENAGTLNHPSWQSLYRLPLGLAIDLSRLECVSLLLHYGASVTSSVTSCGLTALQLAVQLGNIPIVLELLRYNADWRTTDKRGNTILHLVFDDKYQSWSDYENHNYRRKLKSKAEKNIIDVMEIFIPYGANVNKPNKDGKTPLYLAVEGRMTSVVEFLIKHGANVRVCDSKGDSLVLRLIDDEAISSSKRNLSRETMLLLRRESMDMIEWLLSKGVNADCKNQLKRSALQAIVTSKLHHLLPILLRYANDVRFVDVNKRTLLHLFLESIGKARKLELTREEIVNVVKMFLNKGISVDAVDRYGNTPLHIAARLRNKEIVMMMLERFTNVNAYGCQETILHALIDTDDRLDEQYALAVRGLIFNGADFARTNKRCLTPLQLAAMHKHKEILDIFVECDADLLACTNGNDNLLHLVSKSTAKTKDNEADKDIVRLLVNQGCDVNAINNESLTPLHLASQIGNVAVVQALIEHGADVHFRVSSTQLSSVHLAAKNDREDAIEVLARNGVDVNARDSNGKTPLHLATVHRSNVVKTLLRLGACVDVMDDEGRLPLHCVMDHDNVVGWESLIEFGADINDVGNSTKMPFQQIPKFNGVWHCVTEYLVKLKAANLPVAPVFKPYVDDQRLQYFYSRCVQEIEELKRCMIKDKISVYHLLHDETNCRFVNVKEETLENFKTDFPLYYDLILTCYRKFCASSTITIENTIKRDMKRLSMTCNEDYLSKQRRVK